MRKIISVPDGVRVAVYAVGDYEYTHLHHTPVGDIERAEMVLGYLSVDDLCAALRLGYLSVDRDGWHLTKPGRDLYDFIPF